MVFNGPLESGRQSPGGLAGGLLFAPILIGVFLLLANMFVFMDRSQPAHKVVIVLCILFSIIGVIIAILSFVFCFKNVYETRQSTQYWVSIWLSQFLFGRSLYWISLYMIFDGDQFHHDFGVSSYEMVSFIIGTFIIGFLIFIISFIRLVNQIEKGKFRKNTKKDRFRKHLEENTSKFQGIMIKIGIAISLTVVALINIFEVNDINILIVSAIGITLFFVMWFILPEQLITWYCIKRFDGFNFKSIKNNSE